MIDRKTRIEIEKTIYFPIYGFRKNGYIEILKIVQNKLITQIDCIAYPPIEVNRKTTWVNIHKSICLCEKTNQKKHKLIYAVNIPIAPKKYIFKGKDDSLEFSLIFPAISLDIDYVDLYEIISNKITYVFHSITLN